jgi:hypothetical protein
MSRQVHPRNAWRTMTPVAAKKFLGQPPPRTRGWGQPGLNPRWLAAHEGVGSTGTQSEVAPQGWPVPRAGERPQAVREPRKACPAVPDHTLPRIELGWTSPGAMTHTASPHDLDHADGSDSGAQTQ